jgi:hypothetical protein
VPESRRFAVERGYLLPKREHFKGIIESATEENSAGTEKSRKQINHESLF